MRSICGGSLEPGPMAIHGTRTERDREAFGYPEAPYYFHSSAWASWPILLLSKKDGTLQFFDFEHAAMIAVISRRTD